MTHPASNFIANPCLCLLTLVLTERRQNFLDRLLPDLRDSLARRVM